MKLRNPPLAAFFAWMVPGAGHLFQMRIAKAVLFFVCIGSLYGYGLWLGTAKVIYFRWDDKEWSWPYLAQVGVGSAAMPALFRSTPMDKWDVEQDELHRSLGRDVDLARFFTMIAGLLNFLCIYDAFAGPALKEEEDKLLAERANPLTPEPTAA